VPARVQTPGGTPSLRGQNVLLPETTVLKTNGSGRAFIDLESSSTDASNIHLLGEIDASNLQIVGNNGPNEIIIGDRVGRTVRVFSVGGDDDITLRGTPTGQQSSRRSVRVTAGNGTDHVTIDAQTNGVRDLVLDGIDIDESNSSYTLGSDTEQVRLNLSSDDNHRIEIQDTWTLPSTALTTAAGDDTIIVGCLADPANTISVDAGQGNNSVQFANGCSTSMIAVSDTFTALEDTGINLPVLANDLNVDPSEISLSLDDPQDDDRLSITTVNGVPHLHYTPLPNFAGVDSFRYRIADGSAVAVGTVRVVVANVNDAPLAIDDTLSINEDTQVTFAPLSNDIDIDLDDIDSQETLRILQIESPQHGTLTRNPD
ncbi:MAG: Ig-like domain-containing protein, partial [Planctomycetota bacterium]